MLARKSHVGERARLVAGRGKGDGGRKGQKKKREWEGGRSGVYQ